MTEEKSYLIIRGKREIFSGEGRLEDWKKLVEETTGRAPQGGYSIKEIKIFTEQSDNYFVFNYLRATAPGGFYMVEHIKRVRCQLNQRAVNFLEELLQKTRQSLNPEQERK